MGARTGDIAGSISWTGGHQFRLASIDVAVMWDTKAAGALAPVHDETIAIGLMDVGLSLVELEEALEANYSGPDETVEREQSRRPVVLLGSITARDPHLDLHHRKINMTFPNGIALWAYNPTATAIVASTSLTMLAKMYGVFIG